MIRNMHGMTLTSNAGANRMQPGGQHNSHDRDGGLRSRERDRARELLTAAVTATASHNQPVGLPVTTDRGEVEGSELGLSQN